MQQFIQNIDQFGVDKQLQIHSQEQTTKSLFGGILTIILYGVSFGYFLSEFIDWAQNNKLPKITSFQKQIAESETVPLNGKFFEVSYYLLSEEYIDPFDPEHLILFPIARKMQNSLNNQSNISSQFQQITSSNGKKLNSFYLEDQIIQGSPINNVNGSFMDYIILFGFCNPILIPETFKCANATIIEKFNSQINFFNMQFYTTQYDSRTRSLYKIPKIQKAQVIQNITRFYQYSLQVSNLQADDGILFNNMNNFTFLSEFSLATQEFNQEYTLFVYKIEAAFMAYFTIDQIKQEVLIDYPKISEILADTGSIIAWIMSISILAIKYNEKSSLDQTINGVIQIYYPDFELLKIQTNLFGKFKSVSINDDQQYNPSKVQELMKSINKIAGQKVSFQNILFEISRLQFILIESLGIEAMKKGLSSSGNFKELLEPQKIISENSLIVQRQQETSNNTIYKLEDTLGLLIIQSNFYKDKFKDTEMHIVPKESLQQDNTSIIQGY